MTNNTCWIINYHISAGLQTMSAQYFTVAGGSEIWWNIKWALCLGCQKLTSRVEFSAGACSLPSSSFTLLKQHSSLKFLNPSLHVLKCHQKAAVVKSYTMPVNPHVASSQNGKEHVQWQKGQEIFQEPNKRKRLSHHFHKF